MSEPSAWLYGPNDVETHPPIKMRGPERGEPLFTREAIEAESVAALRELGALSMADWIESGKYRSKSDL